MASDATEAILSLFSNPGLHFIGAKIVENLEAKDIIAFMQATDDFESFVLENHDIWQSFVKKAHVEIGFGSLTAMGHDSMDYILDDPKDEHDERKMKVAVLQFSLHIQFNPKHIARSPNDFFWIWSELNHTKVDIFTQEFKKLMEHLVDSELKEIFTGLLRHHEELLMFLKPFHLELMSDMHFLILNSLKDKTLAIGNKGETAMHYLVTPHRESNKALIQKYQHFLKTWIQLLPATDRCPIDNQGETPLHHLCRKGPFDIDMLKTLCQTMTKEQVGLQNMAGQTPLHLALNKDCATFIQVLFKFMTNDQFGLQDTSGRTPLHSACASKFPNVEAVHFLCKNMTEAKIGLQDGHGVTALHLACANSSIHREIIQILCENMSKDQIVLQDYDGKTPLHHACSNYNCTLEVVQIICPASIMTKEVERQDKEGKTPLRTLCSIRCREKSKIAKLLCQFMTSDQVGLKDENGRTLLHEICSKISCSDNAEIARLLFQKSKDNIASQDNDGKTALHLACDKLTIYQGDIEVIKVLTQIMTKDQLAIQDKNEQTMLHLACANGYSHAEAIHVLCESMTEAKLGLQDKNGKTALHLACACYSRYYGEIIQILCENMSKDQIVLQDHDGKTPLHYACSNALSTFEVVQILCRIMTKEIGIQDKEGKTPLHLACAILSRCHSTTTRESILEVIKALSENMTKDQVMLKDNYGRAPITYVEGNRMQKAVKEYLCKVK